MRFAAVWEGSPYSGSAYECEVLRWTLPDSPRTRPASTDTAEPHEPGQLSPTSLDPRLTWPRPYVEQPAGGPRTGPTRRMPRFTPRHDPACRTPGRGPPLRRSPGASAGPRPRGSRGHAAGARARRHRRRDPDPVHLVRVRDLRCDVHPPRRARRAGPARQGAGRGMALRRARAARLPELRAARPDLLDRPPAGTRCRGLAPRGLRSGLGAVARGRVMRAPLPWVCPRIPNGPVVTPECEGRTHGQGRPSVVGGAGARHPDAGPVLRPGLDLRAEAGRRTLPGLLRAGRGAAEEPEQAGHHDHVP